MKDSWTLPLSRRRCKDFEAFKESLKAFPLNVVAETTGVPAEKITEAARMYANSGPAAISTERTMSGVRVAPTA